MRATVLLLLATLGAVLLPGVSGPAHAEVTCDGVWVVVDARAAGGSLSTRCAAGDPASGFAALEQTGFAYTFVPRIPGMVCTIDARPDPCNGAPTNAYWSYWHAAAGGSWTYATTGAGTRNPSPGSVEGWRYGDGTAPPGTTPPANPPESPPADQPEADPTPPAAREAAEGGATSGSSGSAATSGTSADAPSPESRGASAPAEDTADSTDADSDAEVEALDPGQPDDPPRGPSWRPGPVETGEWSNPPRPDAPEVTTEEVPAARTEEAPVASGTPADEQELALAASGSRSPGPEIGVGAVLGAGLLMGIGALTWRQRRRTGARP